ERYRRGLPRRGWEIEVDGHRYRLVFGDLHEHSEISRCRRSTDESEDQSYEMMRSVVGYDFGALTDHGYNFTPYLWHHHAKRTRANADPGRFLTVLAQEWTSTFERSRPTHPYGWWGHRNLFFADPWTRTWDNATEGKTPEALRIFLRRRGADFLLIPHQLADRVNVPMDWSTHDPVTEPVAEIYQARGSYECAACPLAAHHATPPGWYLQDAWARGHVVGVVAAPEHHGGYGLAAVYVDSLDVPALFEALRARRSYGTTGAKILVDLRVAGAPMGSVRPESSGPVPVRLRVWGTAPIETVEVLASNEVVQRWSGEGRVRLDLEADLPPPGGPTWVYARIRQVDGHMAWTSPVWLGTVPSPKEGDGRGATSPPAGGSAAPATGERPAASAFPKAAP
ncbi:MAG: hypothetical protein D6729_06590, partial [Deltaproteobacteria bacterium]